MVSHKMSKKQQGQYMDFLYKLYNAMASHGICIEGEIDLYSDKFQRFRRERGKGRDVFVRILGLKGAIFGDWHNKEEYIVWWNKDYKQLSFEEKVRRKSREDIRKIEDDMKKREAKKRLEELLKLCSEVDEDHEYVKRKKIIPYGALQIRDKIVIAIRDISENLISVQLISNTSKQFAKDTSVRGGMLVLGSLKSEVIHICEGWATGCSLYEAIGQTVVCSFNAHNLVHVAKNIRFLCPNSHIFIMADDDQHLEDNVGLRYAHEAQKIVGGFVIYPEFKGGKLTDWNDLHVACGIEEVRLQVGIKKAPLVGAVDKDFLITMKRISYE